MRYTEEKYREEVKELMTIAMGIEEFSTDVLMKAENLSLERRKPLLDNLLTMANGFIAGRSVGYDEGYKDGLAKAMEQDND